MVGLHLSCVPNKLVLRKETDIIYLAMGGGVKKVFALVEGGVQKVLVACKGGVKKV